MIALKQNTAATLRVGPALHYLDGITPVTTLTLSGADQAELLKHSGATVDISGATFAAIAGCDGWFDLSLTAAHTDTLGMLTLVVQDADAVRPIHVRALVLPALIYDSLIGGTDNLQVDVVQVAGAAQDIATGTALATVAGYVDTEVAAVLAAVDTEVGAIKAKTDNLPADPADASDIAASFAGVNATLATIAGYVDTEVAAVLAAVDTEVAAIKAKTDQLTFTIAGDVDANTQSIRDVPLTGNGVSPKFGVV